MCVFKGLTGYTDGGGYETKKRMFYTRGAAKSLAQATSRCHRMESIVSAHVLNCKSFLFTEAKRNHVKRCAQFQQH
jgi:hypothetical protein